MKLRDEMYFKYRVAALTGILGNPNIGELLGVNGNYLSAETMKKVEQNAAYIAEILFESDSDELDNIQAEELEEAKARPF